METVEERGPKRTRSGNGKSKTQDDQFDLVQVFSATKAREREALGSKVTEWLEKNDVTIIDHIVTQSSDEAFHCFTITLFCKRRT